MEKNNYKTKKSDIECSCLLTNEEQLQRICRGLDFPQEATACMCSAQKTIAAAPEALRVWQKWLRAYENAGYGSPEYESTGYESVEHGTGKNPDLMDFQAALAAIDLTARRAGVHPYTAELLFFLFLTEPLKQFYEERHINLRIWRDSCMDLRWKLLECHKIYGIWGSFVAWWFPGFFELKRFALGRLQFELVDFPEAYERCGGRRPEGMTKAINVHVPSCGKLTPQDCSASYRQAAEFFAAAFPGDEVAFVCDSWLLFLPNEKMLGPESGIVRFLSEYDIYSQNESDGDLWRIFDRMEMGDPATLPEHTSLQRAYKARLLAGERVGTGTGIFLLQ